MEETPAQGERIVTLDEAVSIAIALQQSGRLDNAAEIYQKILERVPDHSRALHYAGVLAHQQGRGEEGLTLIRRSLELEPGNADAYSNLGIIFRELNRPEEATDALRQAIALDPAHANAHNNLGGMLRLAGKYDEAEASYREAIRLNPEHSDAYTNLGNLLGSRGRVRDAVLCYWKAITINPGDGQGRRMLGQAYATLGELDKAVEIYAKWVEEEPDNPVPRHMLAACSGREVPARATDEYVEKVFDLFASSFDARLERLSYRAPALVADMVARSDIAAAKALEVLDAGCGTGLCGPLLTSYARRLTGVDLSGNMLAQARERNVYDELVKGELTEYLQQAPGRFDMIVSADTLVYFGGLEAVAEAAAGALRPGGTFVFTVEELADATSGGEYQIKPHGRYAHSSAYVERVLARVGLRTTIERAELRMEGGLPVAGFVVRASAASATGGHDA